MTEAAIRATYSDYRRVKGRKVLQLIFEVPIEQAPQVHEIFGEPAPDGSTWVAIARLQELQKPATEKPKRQWSDMSRAQQAGIACNEPDFRRFLALDCDGVLMLDLDMTADAVRHECGIKSRSELDSNKEAAKKWDKLYSDYQLWRRGAAA
jgi:hypothetical protein